MRTKNLIILILFFSFTSVNAAFIDPGWGTRGAGKAGAYIATVDDASAMLWNPASLSQIFMKEAVFSYHKPYAGLSGVNLSMGYFGFAYPVIGVANFGFSSTLYSLRGTYSENSFQLTAAKELSEVLPAIEPVKLAAGVNIKYLTHSYNWDDELESLGDPITGNDSAGALTADAGILFQPAYKFPVGLCVKNIIPADIGLETEDIVPLELSAGAAYRFGTYGAFEDITPEIKVGYRNQEYEEGRVNYALGLESWLNSHTIGIRVGVNNNEAAMGGSYEKFFGSVGIRIDYAAILSVRIGDNWGSHRFSTSVKF